MILAFLLKKYNKNELKVKRVSVNKLFFSALQSTKIETKELFLILKNSRRAQTFPMKADLQIILTVRCLCYDYDGVKFQLLIILVSSL